VSGPLISVTQTADATPYDNSSSALTAKNVRDAIDELSSGSTSALSAKALITTKVAHETISALRIVLLDTSSSCMYADKAAYTSAMSHGMSITSGNYGNNIDIVVEGVVSDASFTFTLGEQLYLSSTGAITSTAPTVGFLSKIGYSLGSGAIYIKIDSTIIL
jgi:hypothetical protein